MMNNSGGDAVHLNPITDLSGFVTLNTTQTITGRKTFEEFVLDGDIESANALLQIFPTGAQPLQVTIASAGGADNAGLQLETSSGANFMLQQATPSDFIQTRYGPDTIQHSFNDDSRTMNFIWSGNTLDNLFVINGSRNNVGIGLGSGNPDNSAILELNTTTGGLLFPRLTTVQRNALTQVEGLVVYDTDLDSLYQTDGTTWSIPGAGQTTLQGAYDNDPTGAQILLDATPNPFSVQAQVAGTIVEWLDVAGNPVLRCTADPDTVLMEAGLTINDPFLNAGAANSIVLSETYTQTGGFVGGPILSNGTITTGVSTTWIWALMQEAKSYLIGINPAFAAFTLFNALATIGNSGNFNLPQALVLNNGVSHRRTTAGTSTTAQSIGLSNSPNTRTLVSGAVMTKTTGDTAVRHSPTYGTVAGSTINFGTQRGLHCLNPALALFQPGAGVENMTAYIGVDVDAIPFGGNVTKRGFRSNLVAASNTMAIECAGTAQSDFNGTINFPVDLVGVQYGASTDWFEAWAAGGFKIEQQNTGAVEQFRKSFPAAGRMLFDWSNDMELNINAVDGFSLGAQSGANGNQFGNFVTSARTIPVGGDWADFLLTQGGNLTVGGLAMGRVASWVINPISYANSTGSVGNADTLTVGGFPTSSPGVTITERQSLNVISGRTRLQSALQFDPINPAALSAGNNNDWAGLLTGTANNGMRHWARVTPDGGGTSVITGIDSTNAQDGDTFKLTNIGTVNMTLGHQDVGSLAANRIASPTVANYVLAANQSAELIYDATSSRWRILYGSGA